MDALGSIALASVMGMIVGEDEIKGESVKPEPLGSRKKSSKTTDVEVAVKCA